VQQTTASPPTFQSHDSFTALAASWRRSLEAQDRSRNTVTVYLRATRLLGAFLAARGMPRAPAALSREHVEEYIQDVLTRQSPTTAATYFKALKVWFAWLEEEGEIVESPLRRHAQAEGGAEAGAGALR
jgi:site-specific recombinase XerD